PPHPGAPAGPGLANGTAPPGPTAPGGNNSDDWRGADTPPRARHAWQPLAGRSEDRGAWGASPPRARRRVAGILRHHQYDSAATRGHTVAPSIRVADPYQR